MPAVLFYSLDRHAPLAMTKGTKWIIPQSLTTPALRATPPMEGNSARNGNVTSSPLRRGAPTGRGGLSRVTGNSTVIAKKCETLKTLSYDCGNPVQYVCGHSPAVLFYLLDRHAPLAMTKGSKYPIPQSLTTRSPGEG